MMDQNFSRLMDKNKVESDLPLGKDEAEHFANEVMKQAAKLSHKKKRSQLGLFLKSFFFGFLLFGLMIFFFLTFVYLKSLPPHN